MGQKHTYVLSVENDPISRQLLVTESTSWAKTRKKYEVRCQWSTRRRPDVNPEFKKMGRGDTGDRGGRIGAVGR